MWYPPVSSRDSRVDLVSSRDWRKRSCWFEETEGDTACSIRFSQNTSRDNDPGHFIHTSVVLLGMMMLSPMLAIEWFTAYGTTGWFGSDSCLDFLVGFGHVPD